MLLMIIRQIGEGALHDKMLVLGLLRIRGGGSYSYTFRGALILQGPILIPILTLWGKANLYLTDLKWASIVLFPIILIRNILPCNRFNVSNSIKWLIDSTYRKIINLLSNFNLAFTLKITYLMYIKSIW